MKQTLMILLLLAAIAGHGQQLSIQFDTTGPGFSCRFLPDGFRVCDGTPEGKILVYLIDKIDSLQKRIDSLEKRPCLQFGDWPGIQGDPGGLIDPGFWNPRQPQHVDSLWIDNLLPIKEIYLGSSDGSVIIQNAYADTTFISDSIIFVPRITPKKKKK